MTKNFDIPDISSVFKADVKSLGGNNSRVQLVDGDVFCLILYQ